MAGADGGGQQLAPLRDVTRWAASFMARLFTGAAPAQLLAEDESRYQSVSTEEDVVDPDGGDTRPGRGAVFGADADESVEQLLADGDGDGHPRARDARSEHCLGAHGVHETSTERDLRRRQAARAADAAMEDESEPLVLRRRAAKRANDVETLDHPFGCDRRGTEASTLLLLSS